MSRTIQASLAELRQSLEERYTRLAMREPAAGVGEMATLHQIIGTVIIAEGLAMTLEPARHLHIVP